MELLKSLFVEWGGFSVWLFIVAIPPQIWRNHKLKKYTSGSLWTWYLFFAAYGLFGLYMYLVGDIVVVIGQTLGFLLCIWVITQSFIYKHAN